VHFGIEAFWWHIAVEAVLRCVNEILSIGWLPYQPSHAFDHVSAPAIDRVLVIVIPTHIVERVLVPHPDSLIIWQASQDLLNLISVFET
jgi:hypothetical protein